MSSLRFIALFAVIVTSFTPVSLPAAEEEKKPARRKRPQPVVSPTIHEDRSVTFRIAAPNARNVSVSGEFKKGKIDLTRGKKGLWSVTVDPVEPGIYGYSFSIDGAKTVDPGNPQLKPQRSPRTSILHIPGGHPFDFNPDIPHGTVHHHGYFSKPIDRYRELRVYTPPGYESGDSTYPLFVLQHGHSDTYATWTDYGKAHWILDHLIAKKKAVPMIVVMLDGHPIPESYGGGKRTENTAELRTGLMDVVLPMIEKKYRVKPGRENRAIAGLSMGGGHSLTIGLNELDTFAWIGAFSAGFPEKAAVQSAFDDAEATNKRLKLFWIACGKDDFLLDRNKLGIAALEEAGINHTWLLTEGNHSWPVWRDYLADFAPLLFK